MVDVGVVVLTMGNRPDELRRGLESLLAQEGVSLDIVCVATGGSRSIFRPECGQFSYRRTWVHVVDEMPAPLR